MTQQQPKKSEELFNRYLRLNFSGLKGIAKLKETPTNQGKNDEAN